MTFMRMSGSSSTAKIVIRPVDVPGGTRGALTGTVSIWQGASTAGSQISAVVPPRGFAPERVSAPPEGLFQPVNCAGTIF